MSVRPDELEEVLAPDGDLRYRVYHYRMAGESFHDIGKRLGISTAVTVRQYDTVVEEMATLSNPHTRDALVALELDRLDMLQARHWHNATEKHERPMVIGSGPSAHVEWVEHDPDINEAKYVLDVMKQRDRLLGLEQLPATNPEVTHQLLVVGQDTASFLAALEQGRNPKLPSGPSDNGFGVINGEVVE